MESNHALDPHDPAVLAVLLDQDAMQTWECLRQLGGRVALAALATAMDRGVDAVGKSLDRLESAGLVRKQRAQRAQRVPTFEVTSSRISVHLDSSRAETRETLARLAEASRATHGDLAARAKPAQDVGGEDVVFGESHSVHLDLDEAHELRRRLASVSDFLALRTRRHRGADDRSIVRSNYMVSMHLAPLAEGTPPSPVISVHAARIELARPRVVRMGDARLSDRELEVARELRDGRTRNEIAARLRVSPHTVHAHCKRIFKKLGIDRASGLHGFPLERTDQHGTTR